MAPCAVDQPRRHFLRMRRRVADPLDARDFRDVFEQRREVGDLARAAHGPAIGVDVLAEQRDFEDALVGQIRDLRQHIVERPRDFLAARIRHHAERAVLAAAFHDRHERGRALDARRRQMIEFLDLGKADVDLRRDRWRGAARAAAAADAASAVRTRHRRRARALTIAAPSCDATQPPTPIMRSGLSALSARTRPRSWNTRSCAFSRTEHVLNRMTSASSGRSVSVRPSEAWSTSAILSESYSFIWQPNVRMYSFFATARVAPGRQVVRGSQVVEGARNYSRRHARLRSCRPLPSAGVQSAPAGVRRGFFAAGETGTRCRLRKPFLAKPRLPPQR